jgi:hypothetical protein
MHKRCLAATMILVLLFCAALAYADYVEVRKSASIHTDPSSKSAVAFRADVGTNLHLVEADTQNGYYHVEDLTTGDQGWLYRSFVRRFPGDIRKNGTGTTTQGNLGARFPVDRCKAPYNEEPATGLAIEFCGLQGDASNGSAEAVQNLRKNNLCQTGTAQPVTISDLIELQAEVDDSGLVYGSRFRGKSPPLDRSSLASLPPLKNGAKLGEGDLVTFVGYLSEAHYMPKSASKDDKKGGESVNCHKTQHETADIHLALNSGPGRIKPKDPLHQEKFCKTISAEFIPHLRPAVWNVDNLNLVTDAERPIRVTGQLFFDGSHEPCRSGKAATGDPQRIAVWEIHPVYTLEVCKFDDIKKCPTAGKSAWQPLSSADGINVGEDEQDQ